MRAFLLVASTTFVASACSVINDYERIPASGGSGGAGADSQVGGAGGAASGMGSGGQLPVCNDAACQSASTDCMACACLEELICHCQPVLLGTPCRQGAGCDGTGVCVECLEASDCPTMACKSNICLDDSCQDSIMNGNETDVDCGGNSCAPCAIGDDCIVGLDCQSGYCAAGDVCQPCEEQTHCGVSLYCDVETKLCEEEKANFSSCDNDYECASGHCGSFGTLSVCSNP